MNFLVVSFVFEGKNREKAVFVSFWYFDTVSLMKKFSQ